MALRYLAALGPLLAAFALNGAAAPLLLRVGAERLVLDAPAGFSDSLGLASPRLQELAESQTSASNRILLFAITDADLRRFMNGDRPEFRRYMIAAIAARLEHERLSAGEFGTLAGASLREMGAPPATTDYLKHIDAQPRGRPQLLAELRNDPLVVSVLLDRISGRYFAKRREKEPAPHATDDAAARRLWEISEKLTGFRYA